MSPKYALPCPCGTSIPVEPRNAGGVVECTNCGELLDVPKLRDLRHLDPIVEEGSSKPRRVWSGLQGALFVVGLLCVAVAAGSALYTYQYKAHYDNFTTPAQLRLDSERIQSASLLDSWKMWEELKSINLASRPEPVHLVARQRVAMMVRWLTFFAGLAAVGLVSMLISFIPFAVNPQ